MPPVISIKFRIIAFGVLFVMAGLALRLFVVIPAILAQVTELVAAHELTVASYVAQDIDRSMRLRLTSIEALAADLAPEMIAQPDKLTAWLQYRQRANPLFAGLLVIRLDGHGLFGGYPAPVGPAQRDYANADWLLKAKQGVKPAIGKPMRVGGAPVLFMAAPVRDATGHIVAVLSGFSVLNASGFLDDLQTTQLGSGGGLLLISPADRMFVASSDPSMVLTTTPPVGTNPLHDRAMNGFRGTGVTVNALGVEEISAIVTVPCSGWFLVARIPTAEALRPATRLRDLALKGTAIIAGVTGALFMAFLYALLRPLSEGARAMRDMASGKRALAQLPIRRQDEIGDLLSGFNHLVEKLHEKEAALHDTVKKLDQLARTDALTGAWNRRQFSEVVAAELDRSQRYARPISLMLLDLDFFKRINDNHGHAGGDRVLQHVADWIREELRKSDSLSRWGGEEFVILMPDTGLSNAVILAERVRACIASCSIEGIGCVTASIGVAEFTPSEHPDQCLGRADAAMYRAKQAGRNRVEVDGALLAARPFADSAHAGFAQLIWSDHFCSGNPTLDYQHRLLFDDSNKLLAAILSERPHSEIGTAVDALARDIIRHFDDEENLLLTVDYPHAAAHAAMHAALRHRARELVGQFRDGSLDLGALFQFLAHDFVAGHILSEDREFFPYLNRQAA